MPFRRISSALIPLLLVLAFAATLVPMGCAPALRPEPEWEKNARIQLEQAEMMFSKRQYDQAAKTAEAFLALYPKSRYRDRALGLMGEIRLTRRDYRQALGYFKELIENYPSSSLIPEARYKLGLCYFELKEYDLAVANLADGSKIKDPVTLPRISEMLSVAYVNRKNYPLAVKAVDCLADSAQPS